MASIIQVTNISKSYIISHEGGKERYSALRDVVANKAKKIFSFPKRLTPEGARKQTSTEEFWALNDINFEINQGERVGIIGRNGAGKSTLLKILSRITEPTTGEIRIKGRVASLLEVGTGFHPELTGRENIYLNGAILGMSRAEIKRKFDEIVDFAEVEKFLDTPVKRYSSGMYVRLAFAVAAHLEPEIMVVDEVLAVGDAQFQKKCLGKMEDVSKNEGRTVLFVSHDIKAIRQLTTKCLLLEKGVAKEYDETNKVINQYNSSLFLNLKIDKPNISEFRRERDQYSKVKISNVMVTKKNGVIEMNENIEIVIDLEVKSNISGAMLDFMLKNSQGENILNVCSLDNNFPITFEPGDHRIIATIMNNTFTENKYFIDLGVNQSQGTSAYDVILNYPLFEIVNNNNVTAWTARTWGAIHLNNISWQNL